MKGTPGSDRNRTLPMTADLYMDFLGDIEDEMSQAALGPGRKAQGAKGRGAEGKGLRAKGMAQSAEG